MDTKNMIFNEEELYKLNIHELRDLARSLGLSSPTTLSKTDLIEKTLQIIYGVAPAKSFKKGAGRPARNKLQHSRLLFELASQENNENLFVKEYESDPSKLFRIDDNSVSAVNMNFSGLKVASKKSEYVSDAEEVGDLRQPNKVALDVLSALEKRAIEQQEFKPNFETENVEVDFASGYVYENQSKQLELCSGDQTFKIDSILIQKYNLKIGDMVEGYVEKTTGCVIAVFAINGLLIID